MRIIAGTLRGLKLSAPDGINTRPTLDRVKEAIFSMLMPYIGNARVLDLFAGSGAMGIEALSRGAASSVFVDCDNNAISCIKNNINAGRLNECSAVYKMNAINYLKESNDKFDIIFLDPPYHENIYSSVLDLIYKKDILSSQGIIVVEWDYSIGFDKDNTEFEVIKEKKYGRVGVTTLKRGSN